MATKTDLVKKLNSLNSAVSQSDIEDMVEYTFEYIKDSISQNNRVEIRGFGSFSLRQRKKAKEDKNYNTIYYRMSKNIFDIINDEEG